MIQFIKINCFISLFFILHHRNIQVTSVFLSVLLFAIALFNPFTLRAAKTGLTILEIFLKQKRFWEIAEVEMLKRSQTTTLLQIFCDLLLYSQVILKSMKVADGTFYGISECEWVK